MKSMGFTEGLLNGLSRQHDMSNLKVFDWNKAARYIKENNIKRASAGLDGDWDCTSGVIFEDGEIVTNDYTYLASTWVIPTLEADGKEIPCYLTVEENTENWNSHTKWPDSSKQILTEES